MKLPSLPFSVQVTLGQDYLTVAAVAALLVSTRLPEPERVSR